MFFPKTDYDDDHISTDGRQNQPIRKLSKWACFLDWYRVMYTNGIHVLYKWTKTCKFGIKSPMYFSVNNEKNQFSDCNLSMLNT